MLMKLSKNTYKKIYKHTTNKGEIIMKDLFTNDTEKHSKIMDYYYGSFHEDTLLTVIDYSKEHNIKYRKLGNNYLFYWNYEDADIDDNAPRGDKYKYLLMITERQFSYEEKKYVDMYSLFGTNDESKVKKFNAFAAAEKINDENNLELNIEQLEGKIFAGLQAREKMSTEGMYLA